MAESVGRLPVRPMSIARHPIQAMILPVPIVCFFGALLTDLAYYCSGGNLLWLNFSSWLIAAGLLFGALALLVQLIDLIRSREGLGWVSPLLFVAAWVVELINALVHARDGWTAVVPLGLTLSVVAVVLVLVGGWLWQAHRWSGGEAP